MRDLLNRLACGLLLSALAGSAAAAGVYRWVDRSGVVHYDDTQTVSGTKMTREYMAKREIPETLDWAGVIPGDVVAEVAQNCTTTKDRLANYRSASQLFGRDPSGNVYPMSPTQVTLMIADTEKEAQYWCRTNAARKVYAERQADLRTEAKAAEAAAADPNKSTPIPVTRDTPSR